MSLWLYDPAKNLIESHNLRTQPGSSRGGNVLI